MVVDVCVSVSTSLIECSHDGVSCFGSTVQFYELVQTDFRPSKKKNSS